MDYVAIGNPTGYSYTEPTPAPPLYHDRTTGLLTDASYPAIETDGIRLSPALPNIYLDGRDAVAGWTASNVTAAQNATGADGTANKATTITATDANGTLIDSSAFSSC